MLDAGCWMLDAGCWMLDAGCWMLDAGCWMLDAGCWMLENKKSVSDIFLFAWIYFKKKKDVILENKKPPRFLGKVQVKKYQVRPTWFFKKSIPAPAKNIYNQQPLRME